MNKYNIEMNIAFDFYGTQIFPGNYVVYGSRVGVHGVVKRGKVVEIRKGKPVCDWDVKKYDFLICETCNMQRDEKIHNYGTPNFHHFQYKYVGIEKERGRAVDPSSCVVVLG